jgi:hypothetical protein
MGEHQFRREAGGERLEVGSVFDEQQVRAELVQGELGWVERALVEFGDSLARGLIAGEILHHAGVPGYD